MNERRRSARILVLAACIGLATATSGCATLARAVLERAAGESGRPPASDLPASAGAKPLGADRPTAVRSTYQHAPTPGRLFGQDRPTSLRYTLFEAPGMDGGCQPVPLGLQQIIDVPNMVPSQRILGLGPFAVGADGPMASLFGRDYVDGWTDGPTPGPGAAVLSAFPRHMCVTGILYLGIGSHRSSPFVVRR